MLKKYYDDSISRNRFDKAFSRAELKFLVLVIVAIFIQSSIIVFQYAFSTTHIFSYKHARAKTISKCIFYIEKSS